MYYFVVFFLIFFCFKVELNDCGFSFKIKTTIINYDFKNYLLVIIVLNLKLKL